MWIQPDHLQKAQKAPFLSRVEPHKRDDFVPLYTTPPGGRQSEDCLTAAQEDIQRLSALVRAQQITIDKLEAQRPVAEPHKWTGLTDEAIWSEYQTLWPFHPAEEPRLAKDIAKFARAIEAKLKEKNQ